MSIDSLNGLVDPTRPLSRNPQVAARFHIEVLATLYDSSIVVGSSQVEILEDELREKRTQMCRLMVDYVATYGLDAWAGNMVDNSPDIFGTQTVEYDWLTQIFKKY